MTRMLGKAEARGLAKKLQRRWYRWRLAFTIIPARHNGIWCGRIYPAKDARMPASLFRSGYPNTETFCKYRDAHASSAMSRRLLEF